ncbi:MAG: glycosyltransferase family 9 protein [Spirosomataceae bacterium]
MKKTKILILRFSSIGDIVLTTPVVRCIKTQWPEAEVHFVTKPAFRSLVEHNPYIDKYFLLTHGLNELIRQLKTEQYDYVVDLHHNLRTTLIKIQLGVKSFSFDKLNWQKWLLVNWHINRLPPVHIVERYLKTVEALGIQNDQQGLDYFIPPQDEVSLASLPQSHQAGYVAFAIGGQHETKKLPLSRMIDLCRHIQQPIVLLGGKEDAENGEEIKQSIDNQHIVNACGKFNLNQSASLLRQATVVYTHDTGLMHIAAAFKKKIISIWGNTVPEFGMYPYRTEFVAWQVANLPCRPCSKIGYQRCPKGHFKCMNELKFE